MKLSRAAAVLACVTLVAGGALASSTFQASAVQVDGEATLQGEGGAIFLLVGDAGLLWEGEAESVTLTRTLAQGVATEHPLADTYLFQFFGDTETRTETFGASTLAGGLAPPGGAMLLRAPSATSISAQSDGLRSLITQQADPRFDQGAPADAEVGQNPDLAIHDQMQGQFVNATMAGGVVEIRGDVTLTLYGLDYELAGTPQRTGETVTSDTGGVVEITDERHELQLTGATLRIRALTPVFIVTQAPTVTYVGSAESADGAALPGAASLRLTSQGSLLAVSLAPTDVSGAGATVAQGPRAPLVTLGLVALFVVGVAALIVWRRRERADDLQLALLAMEERRWSDALPRLTRLAARRPDDTGVLIDRALCLEELGRHKHAARAYERALRVAPRHAEAHFYYARTLARLQQREAGLVHLETALELDPRLVEMARREPALRGL